MANLTEGMLVELEPGYYKKKWTDVYVDDYMGPHQRMTGYHMHEFYEISLIMSGRVNILLRDQSDYGEQHRLVLMRPKAPHYITADPESLYIRKNLLFTADFLVDFLPHLREIMAIFGDNGSILHLDEEKANQFLSILEHIQVEKSLFRQKMMVMCFLSFVQEIVPSEVANAAIPSFVTDALVYMSTYYADRIVAEDLARKMGVSRATLMSAFKKYAGITVNDYLIRCRIKNALILLQQGESEQQVAMECGFTDACNLIRTFKRVFGQTPKQYIAHL